MNEVHLLKIKVNDVLKKVNVVPEKVNDVHTEQELLTRITNKNKFSKNNPIILDTDFLTLLDIKGTNYQKELSLSNSLDARYPLWKYTAEWEEAHRVIRESGNI